MKASVKPLPLSAIFIGQPTSPSLTPRLMKMPQNLLSYHFWTPHTNQNQSSSVLLKLKPLTGNGAIGTYILLDPFHQSHHVDSRHLSEALLDQLNVGGRFLNPKLSISYWSVWATVLRVGGSRCKTWKIGMTRTHSGLT